MVKKPKPDKDPPLFHRLTIDLSRDEYSKLKSLAVAAERSPSRQAKVMLMEHHSLKQVRKNT
jgi:hypothetical protein